MQYKPPSCRNATSYTGAPKIKQEAALKVYIIYFLLLRIFFRGDTGRQTQPKLSKISAKLYNYQKNCSKWCYNLSSSSVENILLSLLSLLGVSFPALKITPIKLIKKKDFSNTPLRVVKKTAPQYNSNSLNCIGALSFLRLEEEYWRSPFF